MAMQKRGYFFTLDVLIALIVIVVGFILIWSSMASRTHIVQPYFLSQDTLDLLASSTVADVSSLDYVKKLREDGNITLQQYDNTLLEQMALYYHQNETGSRPNDYVLKNFTRVILTNATPEQYSLELRLDNKTLYYQQNPFNKPQDDSGALVSSKTVVSVVIQGDEISISEPYIAEVRVWQ